MTDLGGTFADGVHVLPVRVYYEDTDAGGFVYYANYLKFAERARTELLRMSGARHRELMEELGLMLVVRHCEVDYLQPALLDDTLNVHTRIVEMRGASLRMEQVVRRDGVALARLWLRVACVTREGRPARIPDSVQTALKPFQAMTSTVFQQRV